MSFRDRMRVDPSNAEIQVTMELQKQGITELERDWVLLIKDLEVVPMRKEQVKTEDLEDVRFTLPDWFSKSQLKTVELDGPHHKKGRTAERDEELRNALRKRDYKVKEIPYNGRRLSQANLSKVVTEIKEFLEK